MNPQGRRHFPSTAGANAKWYSPCGGEFGNSKTTCAFTVCQGIRIDPKDTLVKIGKALCEDSSLRHHVE